MTTHSSRLTSFAFGLFLLVLGGSAAVLGLRVLATSLPLTTLVCTRLAGTCQLTDANPFSSVTLEFRIADLKGAEMRVWAAGRRGAQYQIVLDVVGMKDLDLGDAAFGEEAHRGLLNQIKRFIRDPRQGDLEVRRDGRWQVYGSSAIALLAGLLFSALGVRLMPFWRRRG